MARKARIKDAYGRFHVRQAGGGVRPLFRDEADRSRFVDEVKRAQRKFGFRLLGCCLTGPDEYHLVLDVNGTDLSSLMKSLNIAYALYAQCEGPLFHDRYQSWPLSTDAEVRELIDRFPSTTGPEDALSAGVTDPAPSCRECLRTLDDAQRHLEKIARGDRTASDALVADRNRRNALIRDFRRMSTLSLKELGQLFGGLSESSVSKILNAGCEGVNG